MSDEKAAPIKSASAREVAAMALLRIEKDDAYGAAALDGELARSVQLDARNRALATELTYGVLRVRPWIDRKITSFLRRGTLDDVAPHIRTHLRVAAYQLYFLDRVPAFAAVNEAVDRVRGVAGQKGAAFANAILRKLATDAKATAESSATIDAVQNEAAVASGASADGRKRLARAALESAPAWLRARLVASVGESHAASLLAGSGDRVPPVGIRLEVRAGGDDAETPSELRARWITTLKAAAPDAEIVAGPVSPIAILLRGAGDPHRLPGYTDGSWALQEEGSQAVALAVGAKPGETILDACAGRGGKSAILVRQVIAGDGDGDGDAKGAVDACDVHPSKLTQLRRELGRVGLSPRNTFAVDWCAGSGEVTGTYDAVLVDAPCSGSGTIRRRPDVLLRRTEASILELTELQLAIVTRAASHVRVGGRLIYAVCSVLEDEGPAIVRALLSADRGLRLAPFPGESVRNVADGDRSTVRLLPDVHGTDGYFLASFVRATA